MSDVDSFSITKQVSAPVMFPHFNLYFIHFFYIIYFFICSVPCGCIVKHFVASELERFDINKLEFLLVQLY